MNGMDTLMKVIRRQSAYAASGERRGHARLITRRLYLLDLVAEIIRKIRPIASRLSKSLGLIDRAGTCDSLLVIRSNHWLISYRFRDIQ